MIENATLVDEETREAHIIWWRPWHDDVWFRNPFSGEAIVVSKRTLPAYWQSRLSAEQQP